MRCPILHYSNLFFATQLYSLGKKWTPENTSEYTIRTWMVQQLFSKVISLTHLFPMHLFSTPWKYQITVRFFYVFRRQRKGALGTNGLIWQLSWKVISIKNSNLNGEGKAQGKGARLLDVIEKKAFSSDYKIHFSDIHFRKIYFNKARKSKLQKQKFIYKQHEDFTKTFKFLTFSWRNDEDLYHIETSPFICRANQWPGFYTIGTSIMKELKK